MKKFLSILLVCSLTATLLLTGCGKSNSQTDSSKTESVSQDDEQTKSITIKVIHKDGSQKDFTYDTTAETLGDLVTSEKLAEGSTSDYGLFITTVDGETADDANQEWWCITKGGESLATGADSTNISDGDIYEFTLTVGY